MHSKKYQFDVLFNSLGVQIEKTWSSLSKKTSTRGHFGSQKILAALFIHLQNSVWLLDKFNNFKHLEKPSLWFSCEQISLPET